MRLLSIAISDILPVINMLSLKDQIILIIAPHPDDEVFGCGGLILRAKKEGAKVYIIYLTVGTVNDFSEGNTSTEKERISELKKAVEFLGVDGYKIAFPGKDYHMKLDALPQKEIINEIERGKDISIEALKPTMILTPANSDYNQDHRAASLATTTASRPADHRLKTHVPYVLTYEFPYSTWSVADKFPQPNVFLKMSEEDLKAKCDALKLYPSQLKSKTSPLSIHGVKTLAYMRGLMTTTIAAEAYWAQRITL